MAVPGLPLSKKCGINSLNVPPFLGKRWQEKVTGFHTTASDCPKGGKDLGDNPEPPARLTWPGQLSPGTSPRLLEKGCFLSLDGVFAAPSRSARTHGLCAQGGPSRKKTARPVLIPQP